MLMLMLMCIRLLKRLSCNACCCMKAFAVASSGSLNEYRGQLLHSISKRRISPAALLAGLGGLH